MKAATKKQVRSLTIGLLACCALLCAVSEPANQETWFEDFLISKAVALAFGYVTYRLYRYWESKGLLLDVDLKDEF